jgi:hypothetical protein
VPPEILDFPTDPAIREEGEQLRNAFPGLLPEDQRRRDKQAITKKPGRATGLSRA